MEQGIPFVLKHTHHRSVKGRAISRPERHDSEGIRFVVRTKERQFWLVFGLDKNLVIPCFVVQTDKIERAGRVAKVIDCIITSRNRVFKRQSDLVKPPV